MSTTEQAFHHGAGYEDGTKQASELLTLARFEVKMLRSIIADVHEVAHLALCTRVTGHIQRAMRMLDESILPKGPL